MPLTRVRRVLILALVLCLTWHASAERPCEDTFACALDTRWPVDLAVDARDRYSRLIIIRTIPGQSVDPEAYVVLRVASNGDVDAEYAAPEGESLFNQIRTLTEGRAMTTQEINKQLKVKSFHLGNSSSLRKLVRDYERARMPAATPDALYVDATRYDISDITIMNRMTLQIFDSPALPRHAVIEWAKATVSVCQRVAAGSTH